jgi:hypothetical protein
MTREEEIALQVACMDMGQSSMDKLSDKRAVSRRQPSGNDERGSQNTPDPQETLEVS